MAYLVQAWGKCESAWMVGGGYCKQTCGRCGGGDQRVQLQKATSPVTLDKASTGGPAPADLQPMSGAKVRAVLKIKSIIKINYIGVFPLK